MGCVSSKLFTRKRARNAQGHPFLRPLSSRNSTEPLYCAGSELRRHVTSWTSSFGHCFRNGLPVADGQLSLDDVKSAQYEGSFLGFYWTSMKRQAPHLGNDPRQSSSSNAPLLSCVDSGISLSKLLDGDSGAAPGLKLLLSPPRSPFCNAASPSASSHNSRSNSRSGAYAASDPSLASLDGVLDNCFGADVTCRNNNLKMAVFADDVTRRSVQCTPSNGIVSLVRSSSSFSDISSKRSTSSVLFDPSLVAAFEDALDKTATLQGSEDCLQDEFSLGYSVPSTSTLMLSSSSDGPGISFDLISDADSSPLPPDFQGRSVFNKKQGKFRVMCPPNGEGKAVLYFTTLRGIRKTYEDCCHLRLILRGLRIKVDERDVSMHAKFKEELREMMLQMDDDVHTQQQMALPQLFVDGQYLGGMEEVEQLHEDGMLVKLVQGVPILPDVAAVCEACGDMRFVPCVTCNGSCKLVAYMQNHNAGHNDMKSSLIDCIEDVLVVLKCNDCNENGLILCPICRIS